MSAIEQQIGMLLAKVFDRPDGRHQAEQWLRGDQVFVAFQQKLTNVEAPDDWPRCNIPAEVQGVADDDLFARARHQIDQLWAARWHGVDDQTAQRIHDQYHSGLIGFTLSWSNIEITADGTVPDYVPEDWTGDNPPGRT